MLQGRGTPSGIYRSVNDASVPAAYRGTFKAFTNPTWLGNTTAAGQNDLMMRTLSA